MRIELPWSLRGNGNPHGGPTGPSALGVFQVQVQAAQVQVQVGEVSDINNYIHSANSPTGTRTCAACTCT